MVLHLLQTTIPHVERVHTWCGRMVPRDRIVVSPKHFDKDVVCKACRKAYSNSRTYDEAGSVSLTS